MPRVALPTFREEILALYSPPMRAKNTWFKVRQITDILAKIGCKSTADLTPATVARFIGHDPTWKPETVKGLLAYLKAVCKYAHAMGYVRVDPFSVRKDWYRSPDASGDGDDDDQADDQEGCDRHLALADLAKLLGHLEAGSASWKGNRIYALTALMMYTGLRRNEGLTRAVADFDLDRKIVRVKARRKQLKTKASNQPVGLPPELVPILSDWLPRCGSKWAFPGVRGQSPWTGGPSGGRAIDELQAAAKAVGIPRATWLMLRHSWATHAEHRGIGELMVQRQLRHTSKRTQRHYRQADEANIAAAVGSFAIRVATEPATGTG